MNKEDIHVITDREELYDKCENMEQLYDKYYLPLLDKHYSKTYKLQQENQQQNQLLKDKGFIIDKLMEENRQLKESRYKAIGHINACGCVLTTDESRYLLDILKGDSNE